MQCRVFGGLTSSYDDDKVGVMRNDCIGSVPGTQVVSRSYFKTLGVAGALPELSRVTKTACVLCDGANAT